MYTLLLRINAPLQAWGSDSLYDDRDTDYYPTKSGMVGMLAAALGLERTDSLKELTLLKFGVRIDNQGVIVDDFQITQMGNKYNSNLSHRKYLSDATFLVGFESDNRKKLEDLVCAINYPKYIMFLGRKSCPPTFPILIGIVEKELYLALYEEKWLVPEWYQNKLFKWKDKLKLRIIIESDRGALKKDVPISYNSCRREYGYRYVKDMPGKVVYKKMCNAETEHDPMEELG